jgi:hypothetical protein
MDKLSWREKYAGMLVLLIGIVFLLMQIASLMSNTSNPYSIQNGSLVIDKNELYSDVRTYSIIITGILAGWLLLKSKLAGWVLSLPILMFVTAVLCIKTIEQLLKTKKADTSLIAPGVGMLMLLLAIVFLFLPSARKKYRVSKGVVLLTLLLFAALGGAYIFLQ